MAQPPYKLMIFLKRRPGMSVAEFRDYYETRHAPLCLTYMKGAQRYLRRFVDEVIDQSTGQPAELPFDVVTETWFADRATLDMVVAAAKRCLMPADVIADEEQLFDRSMSRFATTTECESDLTEVNA